MYAHSLEFEVVEVVLLRNLEFGYGVEFSDVAAQCYEMFEYIILN